MKKQRFVVLSLQEYISIHYEGNNAKYAAYLGITRQSVGELIKRGAVIGDGVIYTEARKG